jgi:hypothetical protein
MFLLVQVIVDMIDEVGKLATVMLFILKDGNEGSAVQKTISLTRNIE